MGVEEWVTGEGQRGMREGYTGMRRSWVGCVYLFSKCGASCLGVSLPRCPLDVKLCHISFIFQ